MRVQEWPNSRKIAIQHLSAKTLTGDILWRPVVLSAGKTVVGSAERDFSRFLSEYIKDIALITTESAQIGCLDEI